MTSFPANSVIYLFLVNFFTAAAFFGYFIQLKEPERSGARDQREQQSNGRIIVIHDFKIKKRLIKGLLLKSTKYKYIMTSNFKRNNGKFKGLSSLFTDIKTLGLVLLILILFGGALIFLIKSIITIIAVAIFIAAVAALVMYIKSISKR
ncbi:MAG: hypothetical protein MI922_08365 [Bacteroidales bacterium]|nr:hypothetical protein [Bacteroidales bacterium]